MQVQKSESTKNFGRIIYDIKQPYNKLTSTQQSIKKLLEDKFCSTEIIQQLEHAGTDVRMIFENDGNVLLRLSKKLQSLAADMKDTEYEPTATGFSKKIRTLIETDNKASTDKKIANFIDMCLKYISNPNSVRNTRIERNWIRNAEKASEKDFMLTS